MTHSCRERLAQFIRCNTCAHLLLKLVNTGCPFEGQPSRPQTLLKSSNNLSFDHRDQDLMRHSTVWV